MNFDTLFFVTSVFLLLFCVSIFTKNEHKGFFVLFSITTLYYSVGGYWYWSVKRDGVFSGVAWGDELDRSAMYLAASSALVFFLIYGFVKLLPKTRIIDSEEKIRAAPKLLRVFEVAGVLGAFYVISSSVVFGGFNDSDPFVLIAYQFSDFIIPVITFRIALNGASKKNVLFVCFFTYYAVMVGLRYKLMLLFLPIVLYIAYHKGVGINLLRRRALLSLAVILLVLLFSLMTTSRQKFSGLDFSGNDIFDVDELIFGFFAETNSLFGLIAAIRTTVDSINPPYIYLQPFFDFLMGLLPKFLFPWRETGGYYIYLMDGLLSVEGANSGTTYPFVGEYILMGGHLGLVLGCLFYAGLYSIFSFFVVKYSKGNDAVVEYGFALLATFFGYYFYSRGYLPQVLKGVLFVVLPYVFMMADSSRLKRLRVYL